MPLGVSSIPSNVGGIDGASDADVDAINSVSPSISQRLPIMMHDRVDQIFGARSSILGILPPLESSRKNIEFGGARRIDCFIAPVLPDQVTHKTTLLLAAAQALADTVVVAPHAYSTHSACGGRGPNFR
uniref:Uncharacterized protein n=1 Tax=Rhodopseudomonas palustris (strain BisA53) TaxID=316055 RepID=Q07QD4_RHOP5